jgi:YVTN family beta-propeller protein
MRVAFVLAGLLAGPAAADVIVVAQNAESQVVLVDPATARPVARFPTGPGPHEVAVSPDHRFAYVADAGKRGTPGKTITVIDLLRREVTATWDLGEHSPHDVRVSRDGSLVWIACAPQRKVLELDADDGSIRRAYDVGRDGGWMVTAGPDDERVFVAHLEGGAVTAIDRATGGATAHVTSPGEMGMDVSPDGAELWAANVEKDTVTVLDARTLRPLATFPSGGTGPTRVRFTPDGRRVVIPHGKTRSLVVFDRARRKPIATIPLPAPPKIVSVSPDGRRAVLTSPPAGLGIIVDLGARRVTGTFLVGAQPDGVAWAGEPRPSRARIAFVINELDLIPEGIAHDPRSGTFFVSSTHKRKIVAVDRQGVARNFTAEAQDGLLGVVGMKVDPARRALWAASSDAGDGMPMKTHDPGAAGRSGVWRYDLDTGKLVKRWLLGGPEEPHFLNDLALDDRGDVYVTDSMAGAVYVLRGGDGELEPFVPPAGLPGANGIVVAPGGRALWVAHRGGVAVVDLATRGVEPLEPAPAYADGLALHRGELVLVHPWEQGRAIGKLAISGRRVTRERLVEVDHPEHVQPTTGVVVGDELFYIANSQLQRFRARRGAAALRPVVVLRVPL